MKTFATQELILVTGEEILSLTEEKIAEWVMLTGGLLGRVANPPGRAETDAKWKGWTAIPVSDKSDVWRWVAKTNETKKIFRDATIKFFMKEGGLTRKEAVILHNTRSGHKHKVLPFIKLVLRDEYAKMAVLNYPCDEIELVNNWRRNWSEQIPRSLCALKKNEMGSLAVVVKAISASAPQ